jgi:hypothetical protein
LCVEDGDEDQSVDHECTDDVDLYIART